MGPTMNADAPVETGDGFLRADGEAARLIHQIQWEHTPLGPTSEWPVLLRVMLRLMLRSRQPMFLWWGPELIQFYNDAYIPIFGIGKHPAAMGQQGVECWREVWPLISPQIDDVMSRGKGIRYIDARFSIFRNGRMEEIFGTYSYSPITDDDGTVAGTLAICEETTERVVTGRRNEVVRALADALGKVTNRDSVVGATMRVFRESPIDIPAAFFYRGSPQLDTPVLVQESAGEQDAAPRDDEALRDALSRWPERLSEILAGRPARINRVLALPGPRGSEPVTDAFLVPTRSADGAPGNELVAYGLNPRVPFDDGYRQFLEQLTESISVASTLASASRARVDVEIERNNLLMQAPVATAVLIGPSMVFGLANPMFCQITGRTGLEGKSHAEVFPELEGTELPGILQEVYRTGTRYVSAETLVRLQQAGKEGVEDHYVEFNLEPMRNRAGAVYGIMAVAVDVTAQVQARHAMERSHAERQQLLEQAEAASQAKDEFLAMLGHELRNPLSPIVTALEVMRQSGDSSTQKEQAIVQRQVDHLVRLVQDLLDVSAITRGKVQLRRSWTEVQDILTRAAEMARPLIDRRRHALVIDVPREPVHWLGDADRLAQVVSNLLINSARYTPPGGRISLAAEVQREEIVIRVRDTGIGIPADLLPNVFDLFFQGRRTVDRAEGGLGLGLALVRNLVAMHGGTTEAFSEGTDQGSEFVVRLPLVAHDASDERQAKLPSPAAFRPLRILIVDDNRDAAESLAELLRMDGHVVQVAFRPLAGLAISEEFRPEVALLDIGLPEMDGYELARRFRKLLGDDECQLIALSGYGQPGDQLRSAEAGFKAHLVKPADVTALRHLLRELPGEGRGPGG